MHKRRINELTIHGILLPNGPLLIKSGQESGADPTLPAMNFVRTQHPKTGDRTIYLPGSSLKGVVRSHFERIVRTVHGDDPGACCDPLDARTSCGGRIQRENNERKELRLEPLSTAEEYTRLCLACRVFGHTVHASHFLSADAYPSQAIDDLPTRHAVAINRFSGGVAVGPFEMEVAISGNFRVRFTLTNFELWQVGLLALVLRDLALGRLLVGFGKSRGLGEVTFIYTHLDIAYPGRFTSNLIDPVRKLYGVGSLAPDLVDAYDYRADDTCDLPAGGRLIPGSSDWGRPAVVFGFDDSPPDLTPETKDQLRLNHAVIQSALKATVPAWAEYKPTRRESDD